MNTNELLNFFTRNYASKNEVLCRLPLNIPIESFWSSLQNHRKSKGNFLLLHSASGMPFWYVLTDKMIAASEKLSEGARNNNGSFDPYKAALTPSLNEEIFFTAFLEGAQIDMQSAMEIIETDKEPSNVQEQIIRNNKNAWNFMLKHLYKPIDDRLVKSLSFYLTEEMAGNSDDYRNSDKVFIPAMEQEQCLVPSAVQITPLMSEFYAFLTDGNIHPLIKAAAGHGFILASRPFADGDERLARILSYAVLLRAGYDYFKDISLSMVIARESFKYFKAMRETIRNSSGGDLTYFIEYFLETLVCAQNALSENEICNKFLQEKALAKQPLTSSTSERTALISKYDWLPKAERPEEDNSKPPQKDERHCVNNWDYTLTRSEAIDRVTQKVKK